MERMGNSGIRKSQDQSSKKRRDCGCNCYSHNLTSSGISTVYTGSSYAYGTVHHELARWYKTGFLINTRELGKHKDAIINLAATFMLPAKVLIIKDKENRTGTGNDAADRAAKAAAGCQ